MTRGTAHFSKLRPQFGSAMTSYLIAAREGMIWWVTLTLMPVEIVFDWLEDEIERHGCRNHDSSMHR